MENIIDELLLKLFAHLNAESLLKCSCVCRRWNRVSKSQVLWRKLVLNRWPSQRWLYVKAAVYQLNWHQIYQEFTLYSWYSPDQMKYFVSCNTIEDELMSPILREAMFSKMEVVSRKWLQVAVLDHDGDMLSRYFDRNMELLFDTQQLKWVFLDKRRGYLDDLFSYKASKTNKQNSRSFLIRPYQVIPSCLLMYRWLCIFRNYATLESGLTFYRIWRFRLKHLETGLIFELNDWKAAMSSTFSNGRPNISSFAEDALELLLVLTHPHFIMHPLGLNPRIEKTFYYAVHASAGGSVNPFIHHKKRGSNKRRKRSLSPAVSPTTNEAFVFGKQLYEQRTFQDIDDRLERWRARRKTALLSPPQVLPSVSKSFEGILSRQSSNSSLFSEYESTTDESQREFTSDCDSEFDFYENGYVTNCEYFISTSHHFDTIEEQHSIQASIADNWIVTKNMCLNETQVLFDIDDSTWYFQSDHNSAHNLPVCKTEDNLQSKMMKLQHSEQPISVTVEMKHNDQPINKPLENLRLQLPTTFLSPPHSPPMIVKSIPSCDFNSGVIEAIPSSLALYRYEFLLYISYINLLLALMQSKL